MMTEQFTCIVAMDDHRGIGRHGGLPWHLPEDLAHFRRITMGSDPESPHAVIMGRKTWESIPAKFRPLPKRHNIVLSSDASIPLADGVTRASSFAEALDACTAEQKAGNPDQVFVIGGASIYDTAVEHPGCIGLHITRVHGSYGCDRFFPSFEECFVRVRQSGSHKHGGITYVFEYYAKK